MREDLRAFMIVAALAIGVSPAPAAAATPAPAAMPATDALSRMFLWWNEAYRTPGAYTAANFRKYFTEEATLVLEGRTIISGVEQWATHFQKIQAGGGEVEIVVPFKSVFENGEQIYNYHVIRSRRGGVVTCTLAAGHADVRDGRIAALMLVRAPLDPAKGPMDPQCWEK